MDFLVSIVVLCSWGKNVVVGIGVKFDFLWDIKEVLYNICDLDFRIL